MRVWFGQRLRGGGGTVGSRNKLPRASGRCVVEGLTFSRTISHWPSITAVNRDGSGVTDPPRYVRFMANPHARLAAMPWLQIVARIAQGLPPQLHASNFGVACGNLTEKAQTRNNKMNSWWLTSYGLQSEERHQKMKSNDAP